jgi:hypothetical protein
VAREKGPEWMALHKLLYRTLLYTGYTEAEVQRKKRVETIYGKFSGWLASTRAEAEDAVLNRTTRETTLSTSSHEATPFTAPETTLSSLSCEATPSVPAMHGRAPPNTCGNRVTGAGRGNSRGSLIPTTSA